MKIDSTRYGQRPVVWGAVAALLFLAGCGAFAQPSPTITPPPTATLEPTSTAVPTATATVAAPTLGPEGESDREPVVLPMKGDPDAPVTIVEFSDYL